jgi:hypothetical protein
VSWIKDLRDALRTQIQTTTGVTTVADWVIEIQREKLTGRELHLAPASRKSTNSARGCKHRSASFVCMLVYPDGTDANAEAAQVIVDSLETLLNARVGVFSIVEIEQPQVLDPMEWREQHKLSTTIIFTLEAVV